MRSGRPEPATPMLNTTPTLTGFAGVWILTFGQNDKQNARQNDKQETLRLTP